MIDNLETLTKTYENTAAANEELFRQLTLATDSVPWLKEHRDAIEQNSWGYGERAFHFMWYLLLQSAAASFGTINIIEIGVFKGQVLSLWALISKKLGLHARITGISPLEGNTAPSQPRLVDRIRRRLDPRYRKLATVGNIYESVDYEQVVSQVFEHFGLNLKDVELVRAYSTEERALASVQGREIHVIYIDGDHSYEGALYDIEHYTPLVVPGGFVVVDDSAFFLPGKGYFKGYESVSRACEKLPELGFSNVLNVGHNRVFRRNAG